MRLPGADSAIARRRLSTVAPCAIGAAVGYQGRPDTATAAM